MGHCGECIESEIQKGNSQNVETTMSRIWNHLWG
jgi:hypothetical protein